MMKRISAYLLWAGIVWGAIFLTLALILGRNDILLLILLLVGGGGVWGVMILLAALSPTRNSR